MRGVVLEERRELVERLEKAPGERGRRARTGESWVRGEAAGGGRATSPRPPGTLGEEATAHLRRQVCELEKEVEAALKGC